MASLNNQGELENILKLLNLEKYYPDKLTRDDLYQITQASISMSSGQKGTGAEQFINNITRYNYQARNIQLEEKENSQNLSKLGYRERAKLKHERETSSIHPLDVISAVFLCCDPTARQDLVMHLWGCKLAVPFVFRKTETAKPSVYIWPLRCLISQFQDDTGVIEMPLINKRMKSVAMLRIGENSQISKSHLLNCLIGGLEKSHPIFFHRNLEGSKRIKSNITEGMIELGWCLSTESDSVRLDGPRFFLNVRGNTDKLKKHRKFIGQIATVTIVLSTTINLDATVDTITDLLKYGSRVILLLADESPDTDMIELFLENNFEDVSDTVFDIVTVEGKMMSEIVQSLVHNIRKLGNNSEGVLLYDFVKNLSNMEFDVDETQQHYVAAFEATTEIVSTIQQTKGLRNKESILPLQHSFWRKWSNLDRDYWRYDQLEQNEKKKYVSKNNVYKELQRIRKQQYKHFKEQGLSPAMTLFIQFMFANSTNEKKIFLRLLKLELDNLSRKQLLPLDKRYQKLINDTISANEKERTKINMELSDIEEMKIQISFGLEHILREIGQIFEACESQSKTTVRIIDQKSLKINFSQLPELACFLLLEGYPIEVLDGEACAVPTLWLKSILNIFPTFLKKNEITNIAKNEIKVHVVSVLGIQSSGKSTFLNTIFGLQFPVSAGRCTRGAFMQSIKVHESLKGKLDVDYLIAIDTEGLRAAELVSDDSRKRDNELSTFVIGMADTTVITLMGENATYLQENLPIAVHAFLRMNLAGLHPRCTIVHHNVDKRNKEKLLVQGRILEKVLNSLTNKACELERIPSKMFHDIIEFSISKNTDYIPALYEGEQPMAPVSVGYSKEADQVRRKIIELAENAEECSSMSDFARHIESLWNAIKKDRFVYEFRTTLEAEARLELDQQYCSILMDFLSKIEDIVESLKQKLDSKKETCDVVEQKFKESILSIEKKSRLMLERFITTPKRRATACYEQWKEKCLKGLDEEMNHHKMSAIQQIRDYDKRIRFTLSIATVEEFFDMLNTDSISLKKSKEECFDKVWDKWAKCNKLVERDINVIHDTVRALHDVCPSHKHLLEESVIQNKSLNKFQPDIERHYNYSLSSLSKEDKMTLFNKMNSLGLHVAKEYKIMVNDIMWKRMPYTDRHPKQILLKMESVLSDILNEENSRQEISNKFKIDLLFCVAGSIVVDFETIVHSHSILKGIKEPMRKILDSKRRNTKEATNELLKSIFRILKKKVTSSIPSFVPRCIISAVEKSSWRGRVATKESLFGYFLYHIISQDEDKMLETYVLSPKYAALSYLEMILMNVLLQKLFVPDVKETLISISNQFAKSLNSNSSRNITFSDVLEKILNIADIDMNFEKIEKYNIRDYQNQEIDITTLKELFHIQVQGFIDEHCKYVERYISEQTEVLPFCAVKIYEQLAGCKESCPLCGEMCKLSSRHYHAKHECFVHRPVGCVGYYYTDSAELSYETCSQHFDLNSIFIHLGTSRPFRSFSDLYPKWSFESTSQRHPSLLWKWIFVNKSEILKHSRNLKLPSELPEHWKNISRKEVLKVIREEYRLY